MPCGMPTIADVARTAGVSIATVSRVLSPGPVPHPVSPDTAARVRAAARALHFVPSPLARGLAARRSGLVGLVVPDLADPHYPHIASGVEEGARDAELAVLICNTLGSRDRLAEYLILLRARRVDAIVLSGATSLDPADVDALRSSDVPVVVIGRPPVDTPWPSVSIDNRRGARAATAHLLDVLDADARDLVHLAGPPSQTTMADRAAGFHDACTAAGSRARGAMLISDGSPEDGYRRLSAWLRARPAHASPVAVFAATDRLAFGALGAAADLHLHVPNDLAVIGFDDVPWAAQSRPTLSSMAQPAQDLGRVALALAQRLATGEAEVGSHLLQARLVARESTRGPGGRYC